MRRSLSLLVTALVATGTTLLATGSHAATSGTTTSTQTIPGEGGTPLKAFVITANAPGPHPLLVMPSSWGTPDVEYVGAAEKLASDGGYNVISYTSRGFYSSGGKIDVAGPDTVADVSRVIDWGLAHTPSDAREVGVAGISYGAGLGLLAAAKDPRIKAVAAMSGWSDLVASLYPGKTINNQSVTALLALGDLTGHPGPDMQRLQNEYFGGHVDAAIADAMKLAPVRSAATQLKQINANHPAILMANSWQDSIFPPAQLTDFFSALTGPKHLILGPGDHATAELPGAFGLPNHTWTAVSRWFDHYLRGIDNGIAAENPVALKASNGGAWQGYPDWNSVQRTATTSYLGGKGTLSGKATIGWHDKISAGVDTVADSGTFELTGALQGYLNVPNPVLLPLVPASIAGVWNGPSDATAIQIRGSARLHTTVTPSTADTSLFAYLYDVGPFGFGSLITCKPYSLRDATPGKAQTVD
ncbi:MAG: CocE/NonD family hydrolase, partial [Sciscionella sp.]